MQVLRRLFLEDSSTVQREPPHITVPDEITPRPPYRNPSKYKISVLTLLCNLGVHIDIDIRCFYESVRHNCLLPYKDHLEKENYSHTPGILDIQYRAQSYGCTSFGEKKDKSSREKTFGNQCTMRILFEDETKKEGYNIINVKLFNNGTLQFTGITSVEEAEQCVKLIAERIDRIKWMSAVHEQIVDFCSGIPSYTTHVTDTMKQICSERAQSPFNMNDIFEHKRIILTLVRKLGQKDIFRLSEVCKYFNQLLSHTNNNFWRTLIFGEFGKLYTQHPTSNRHYINNCDFGTYVPKLCMKQQYFKLRTEYCNNGSSGNYKPNVLMATSSNSSDKLKMSNKSIEMINSNFTTHFFINQRKLTKILQKDYPYINSSYEPDDKYHGIKIYWPHPDSVKENGDNTDSVDIFISIFRTGSVLMSGAKSPEQLDDAYKFINAIIKKNYTKVWIPKDK